MDTAIIQELGLKNGNDYFLAFLSLDIAGSSKIVGAYDSDQVHDAFMGFREFVAGKVMKYGGTICQWEGDGGTVVFKEDMFSAVMCGVEIVLFLILYNLLVSRLPENINIRAAIHGDTVAYTDMTDLLEIQPKILADDVQKQATPKNNLVISDKVYHRLPEKTQRSFEKFFFTPLEIELYEYRKAQ